MRVCYRASPPFCDLGRQRHDSSPRMIAAHCGQPSRAICQPSAGRTSTANWLHGHAPVALAVLLVPSGCAQQTENFSDAELKEQVIRHLEQESLSVPAGASYAMIETFDRRTALIAATGVFRSQHEDRERVGRFWVELRSAGSSWEPTTILIRSQDASNAENIRWP